MHSPTWEIRSASNLSFAARTFHGMISGCAFHSIFVRRPTTWPYFPEDARHDDWRTSMPSKSTTGAVASPAFRPRFRHLATPPLMQNGQAYGLCPTHPTLYSDMADGTMGSTIAFCVLSSTTCLYMLVDPATHVSCFQRAQCKKGQRQAHYISQHRSVTTSI